MIKFNELQNFLPHNFYGLRYTGKVLKLAETKLSLHPAGTDLYTIYNVSWKHSYKLPDTFILS